MREGRIVQTMDSRYPTCTNAEKMKEQIKAAIGTGASLEKAEGAEPFYIAADTPAIKACIETYNEVTGENATPFTMGGATYVVRPTDVDRIGGELWPRAQGHGAA